MKPIVPSAIQAPWYGVPAPAKLNLFLHINGRRADGYHLLQTVFQFISLYDTLDFFPRSDSKITWQCDKANWKAEQDLGYRAAVLLQKYTQTQQGVDIIVHKKIPAGGGLGGGSSDAATVLLALNQFWSLNVSIHELKSLGIQLGADVPVFIGGKSAWAEGIGDKLTPIDLPEPYFLVIKPDCEVSTAKIFQDQGLTRGTKIITMSAFLADVATNDCKETVCKHYPPVKAALVYLNQYASAKLTGTGACVFAKFESKTSALAAQKDMSNKWQSWVVSAMNQSPVNKFDYWGIAKR